MAQGYRKNDIPDPVLTPGEKHKWETLEERLQAIEGVNIYGTDKATDLCLVQDIIIPPKFKVPDFDKYDGTGCPQNHLIMYCRKMAAYAHDEKLLIHFFQNSLMGASSRWYLQLDRAQIKGWRDLANAFVKQYRYNIDTAPDRMQLQNMEKKSTESFKQYAQKWRELAAQVQPPMTEKEMTATFISTLRTPYYDHIIGNTSTNFADIVIIGERIEDGIKKGRISSSQSEGSGGKKNGPKKGEVQVISHNGGRAWRPYHNSIPQYTPQYTPSHYPHQNPPPHINYAHKMPYPSPRPPPQINTTNQIPRPHFYPHQPINQLNLRTPRPTNQPNYYPAGQQRSTQEKRVRRFDPIPMPYAELLPHLLQNHQIALSPMKPMSPPYPPWHNPIAKCDFHAGAPGHFTEDCVALKHKVQDLIDAGWLDFKKMTDAPDVGANPLPNHENRTVNVVEEISSDEVFTHVAELRMSMKVVFDALNNAGMIQPVDDVLPILVQGEICEYHMGIVGHAIQECVPFRQQVQKLMDSNRIQFFKGKDDKAVKAITEDSYSSQASSVTPGVPRPLVIHYFEQHVTHQSIPPSAYAPKPLMIQVSGPFPYKTNKAVPWKYSCEVSPNNDTGANFALLEEQNLTGNIAGVGGLTRSGRCYNPADLERQRKGKEKEEAASYDPEFRKAMQDGRVKELLVSNGPIHEKKFTDEEAGEFLKLMKQSEYSVVQQLNHTPARISLLSLFLNSESHRAALLKVLNQAHVSHDISVESLDGIVGNIVASNFITFTDDEIPPEGTGHCKALHISVKCKDYIIARVLIDNGSSLNVMPKSTLAKLPVDQSHMVPSHMVVRAFDGTRRQVIGDIEIPIQIGPCTFNICFQVMDITPSYSFLLGRPWIHSAGAIPSSLHQKIKFIVGNNLICVSGEEELLVTKPSTTPYVEAAEEALECSFRSFEVASATYMIEGTPMPPPQLSKVSLMVAKTMMKNGHKPGKGLGKWGQGVRRPIQANMNENRFGLGFKPSQIDMKRSLEEKKERRLARLEYREPKREKLCIPLLSQTFHSAGFILPSQTHYQTNQDCLEASENSFEAAYNVDGFIDLTIQAIDDDEALDTSFTIFPCDPDVMINNWKILELPVLQQE